MEGACGAAPCFMEFRGWGAAPDPRAGEDGAWAAPTPRFFQCHQPQSVLLLKPTWHLVFATFPAPTKPLQLLLHTRTSWTSSPLSVRFCGG